MGKEPSLIACQAAVFGRAPAAAVPACSAKFGAVAKASKEKQQQLKENMMAVVKMTKDPNGEQRVHLK